MPFWPLGFSWLVVAFLPPSSLWALQTDWLVTQFSVLTQFGGDALLFWLFDAQIVADRCHLIFVVPFCLFNAILAFRCPERSAFSWLLVSHHPFDVYWLLGTTLAAQCSGCSAPYLQLYSLVAVCHPSGPPAPSWPASDSWSIVGLLATNDILTNQRRAD